jgi:hypothetical protein
MVRQVSKFLRKTKNFRRFKRLKFFYHLSTGKSLVGQRFWEADYFRQFLDHLSEYHLISDFLSAVSIFCPFFLM